MARERPAVCIDASVGAKWFLKDEDDSQAALALLERYVQGKLHILVPDLFFYEIGNLLSLAVRRQRLPEKTALQSLEELERLHLEPISLRGEGDSALSFSQRLNLSFYDAAYLAAAESRGVPLVTSDKNLLKAADTELGWVLTLAAAVEL
jgi:predicted nucleic acid-binding protein